jgi:hypothetical protein
VEAPKNAPQAGPLNKRARVTCFRASPVPVLHSLTLRPDGDHAAFFFFFFSPLALPFASLAAVLASIVFTVPLVLSSFT